MNRLEPREDARLNRQRIIEAARDVFREHGVAAEIREIAERAGLGVGTIYRNYPSKDDLIIALLDDALADLKFDTDGQGRSAIEEIESMLTQSLTLTSRYGWLIEAYLGGQISERCREAMKRKSLEFDVANRYRGLLARGIETGQLRPEIDIEHTTALLLGASSPWVNRHLLEKETPSAIASCMLRALLVGIGAEAD